MRRSWQTKFDASGELVVRDRRHVDPGTTCSFGNAESPRTTFTCTDDGTFAVTLTADDGVNAPVSDSAEVTVRNLPSAPTTQAAMSRDHPRLRPFEPIQGMKKILAMTSYGGLLSP